LTQQSSKRARPSPTIRVGVLGLFAAVLLAVATFALAPRADAYIYWTNSTAPGGSIGRADLDGSDADRSFMKVGSEDIAVDAEHVYWSKGWAGIGRANLDGRGVNRSFITGADSRGLTVDASHVYWTDIGSFPSFSDRGVGRANLDGSGVDQNFINSPSPYFPTDVAVDSDHVYWAQYYGTIGRANLDGSGVDQSFISGANSPVGLTVDARHVYWTNDYTGTIGRANLDGTGVDQSFISGKGRTLDVAVDAKHVYWAQAFYIEDGPGWTNGRIGRADLDGTNVDQDLVSLQRDIPWDLAIDAFTANRVAGEARAARTQRQRGTRIIVKVRVRAKERLTAKATGKIKVNPTFKVKSKTVKLARGETKTLKLKPKKAEAKKIAGALKRGEKAKARLSVELTGLAGNRETEKLRVRLKR
jgi:hypothetical protein